MKMAMKKYIYIIMCSLMALSMTSCNDYLEVYPENVEPTDKYWSTKEEVESTLFAAYYNLRDAVADYLIPWGELRAGCIYNRKGNVIQQFQIKPTSSIASWAPMYKIINNANLVLANAEKAYGNDDTYEIGALNSHYCEAYFLRALAYFYIVRNWKNAPLITVPFETDEFSYNVAASSDTAIIAQIKNDLNTAIKLGAAKTQFDTTWETKGRATIWAIYALMADVCLWNSDFDEAISYANAILNSKDNSAPKFLSTSSRTSWFAIFNPGNSNESIFELQWSYEKRSNDGYQTNNLSSLFQDGNDNFTYLYSTAMMENFESEIRDIQMEMIEENTDLYVRTQYGGYFNKQCWKYVGGAQGTTTNRITEGKEDPNFIIYRVADIMLLKAEALVMRSMGTNADDNFEAVRIVNQIRNRTNLNDNTEINELSDAKTLLDAILYERIMELAGEGKAWYDFLRLGHYKDPSGNINFKKEFLIDNVMKYNIQASSAWINSVLSDENAWYLPITDSEIKANDLLVQNPYYI